MNPRIGNRPLGNGIVELRDRSGARVIIKQAPGDVVQILGIANKDRRLQSEVIKEVLTFYKK